MSHETSVGARFVRPARPALGSVDAETQQRHLAIAREFVERGLGAGDMDAFDRLVAPDVWVSTGLKPGAPITSRHEYKAMIAATLGRALSFETAELEIQDALITTEGGSSSASPRAPLIPARSRASRGRSEADAVRNAPLPHEHGRIVENYVGALNPLQWEMIYADSIRREVLP